MSKVARPYQVRLNGKGEWVGLTELEFKRALKEWKVARATFDEFMLQLEAGHVLPSPVSNHTEFRMREAHEPLQHELFA